MRLVFYSLLIYLTLSLMLGAGSGGEFLSANLKGFD
jgi:hypothetical protein